LEVICILEMHLRRNFKRNNWKSTKVIYSRFTSCR
jgi:hypothetical protein